jgi:hypothetical protein
MFRVSIKATPMTPISRLDGGQKLRIEFRSRSTNFEDHMIRPGGE